MRRAPRGEEVWAAEMIERTLSGVVATHHDDGSEDGMCDMLLRQEGTAFAAVEVVAAADSDSIEYWNAAHKDGGRRIIPGIAGGWLITGTPATRVSRLLKELPNFLKLLEDTGMRRVGRWSGVQDAYVDAMAAELGIVRADQSATDFPGSVYLMLERPHVRSGGVRPTSGEPLRIWLEEYLAGDKCADVRTKLVTTERSQHHVFVYLPMMNIAPFGAYDVLCQHVAPLPTQAPALPEEITHVWAASTLTIGEGLRWDPAAGWLRFPKFVADRSQESGA